MEVTCTIHTFGYLVFLYVTRETMQSQIIIETSVYSLLFDSSHVIFTFRDLFLF